VKWYQAFGATQPDKLASIGQGGGLQGANSDWLWALPPAGMFRGTMGVGGYLLGAVRGAAANLVLTAAAEKAAEKFGPAAGAVVPYVPILVAVLGHRGIGGAAFRRFARGVAARGKIPAGAPGSAEHKAAAWKAYQERGGEWNQQRWSNVYEENMVRARAANKVADDYHATLGWGKREVSVDAGGQVRKLDIADEATKRGIEVKSGKTVLNKEIRSAIARDTILKKRGWDIRWHFAGTASKPLLEALDKAGIPYTGVK
jgi:hypothetical protein